MSFFLLFLTDQLEEPEFQKAHEYGNNSYAYNFYIKLMRHDFFGIFANFSLSNISSNSDFLPSLYAFLGLAVTSSH